MLIKKEKKKVKPIYLTSLNFLIVLVMNGKVDSRKIQIKLKGNQTMLLQNKSIKSAL